MRSVIEVFSNGQWIRAAEVASHIEPWRATFEYLPEYVFGDHAIPVSLALPVSMNRIGFDDQGKAPLCPPFLFDLVPQGRGRQFLIGQLNLTDGPRSDLLLAQFGAHNPIGNLRFDTAVDFFQARMQSTRPESSSGFELDDMLKR